MKRASPRGSGTPRVDLATHRLAFAEYCPSANADLRPEGEISLLVVHAISLPPDEFVGCAHIDALFQNRLDPTAHPYFEQIHELRVSAHACIFRDGSVHQYVPFDRRAWHAGVSHFDGRDNCNDFSVGIELEGCDTQPFTDIQYDRLAQIARALMQVYPDITVDRIVGHSDIAPGRKTDPGPCFDWNRLQYAVEFGR